MMFSGSRINSLLVSQLRGVSHPLVAHFNIVSSYLSQHKPVSLNSLCTVYQVCRDAPYNYYIAYNAFMYIEKI